MPTGAITEYVDVAQVVLYVFWGFFFFLILYLHRESKREGYPLETDRERRGQVQGFPAMPPPKTYALPHGGTATVSNGRADRRAVQAVPAGEWPGAPLEPTGNPMVDGVGPAAWAERADEPDRTFNGEVKIVPLRTAEDFLVAGRDPDPRGMRVVAADGKIAGTVRDVWVDRAEVLIRFLEVELSPELAPRGPAFSADGTGTAAATAGAGGAEVAPGVGGVDGAEGSDDAEGSQDAEGATGDGAAPRTVLVPMMLAQIKRMSGRIEADPSVPIRQRLIDGRPFEVRVASVCAHHFPQAPLRRQPDQVTLLEEDRAMAYFGSGHLYAMDRREPLL